MRAGSERGSATVWVVALAAVLALVGVAVVLVGAAMVARHRAAAAADLAALAAAQRAVEGEPEPCAVASRLATANAARLTDCRVEPMGIIEVAVSVPVDLGGLALHEATARARAGPVWTDPAEPTTA